MKKITIGFSILLSASSFAEDLTIVSWGGAFQDVQREVYFKPFEKESGKTIKEAEFNGGLTEIAGMIKNEKPVWDVVQVESSDLLAGCAQNYFEVLDWNKIGQKSEYIRGASHPCGVGSIVWAMVMSYNQDLFPENPPTTWKDFWDIEKYPGKRGLRKTAKFTLEIALLAAGFKGENVYAGLRAKDGPQQAMKKLEEILPHIEWWEQGSQPPQWLQTKNVSMTAAYNGRISDANKEGNKFRIIWKDALYSMDYWVILKGSPHKDAAYQFLRFISIPKRQAELSELIPYAPTLKRAYRMLKRDTQLMLPDVNNRTGTIFPLDANFWSYMGDKIEAEFQNWLKSKGVHKEAEG